MACAGQGTRKAGEKIRRLGQQGSLSPHKVCLGVFREEEERIAKWAEHWKRLSGYHRNSSWRRIKEGRKDAFQKNCNRSWIGSTLMFFEGHKGNWASFCNTLCVGLGPQVTAPQTLEHIWTLLLSGLHIWSALYFHICDLTIKHNNLVRIKCSDDVS